VTLDVIDIELDELIPATWNANRVTPAMLRKVRRSIDRYGLVENLVVRRLDGGYEVLSGNHRLGLLRDLGHVTAPCVVVELDDARARLLAQALNRRGVDNRDAYRRLIEDVLGTLDVDDVTALLPETPRSIDRLRAGLERENPLAPLQRFDGGFAGGLESGKLGYRLLAIDRCAKTDAAVEVFAGAGALTWWYRRRFKRVVTNDLDPAHDVDVTGAAADYIATRLLADGPFDFVDLDDEGSPHAELDALFTTIAGAGWPPFVLAVTDGAAIPVRIHSRFDFEKAYRWPTSREKADTAIYDRLPELVDHGVRTRATESGCRAETIAVAWRRSKRAVYGAWVVTP
jgi:ParB family chromosome partitioning protein